MVIELTRITSTKPSTLTKRYSLAGNGKLEQATAANMVKGSARVMTVKTASEFAELLSTLEHNQALCYGVSKQKADNIQVLSRKEFEAQGKPADAITRTKEHFKWPEAGGIMMLDYDPQDGQPALTKQQLIDAVKAIIPNLEQIAYVWWASSSSLIFNTETQEQLTPIKGQRLYILVSNASDIERAGKVLHERLWLNGHGYFEISKAGSLLDRSIVDASVWQTNRLDFAAGAQCSPPLKQRRGKPLAHDGVLLDTGATLPDLTEAEKADIAAARATVKEAIKPEQEAIKLEYIEQNAIDLLESNGIDVTEQSLEAARQTIGRAVNGGVLTGDFTITLADKVTKISIGDALDNPSKYHGALTLDPLEPEYGNYRTTGKLYLIGGNANLYSQAHGGRNYRLIRQPKRIQHNKGGTAETTHKALEYLKQMPDVFDYGEQLAIVRNGRLYVLNRDSLGFYLGSVAQFYQWKKVGGDLTVEENIDPPERLLRQILAQGSNRRLKPLKGIITAPIIDLDGRIINKAGYDKKTELFLDLNSDPLHIPQQPTEQDAEQALEYLLQPFKEFRTATVLDNSTLLAAILTAIVRAILPAAPAIGLDAPVQGTGKTYLASCIAMLATGEQPTVLPHTAGRDDEETRKRIFSVLLAGDKVMIWDNILGHFDSASMASLLTSDSYSDRILGASERSSLPNRLLVCLTGNNLAFAGDMPRRVLKVRLDTQVENPAALKYNGNPLQFIEQNRQKLVVAGLTIIKAYLCSDAYKQGGAVKGESTGSFEQWDKLVRQPVAWISQTFGLLEYQDPADALKAAIATDPEKENLSMMLQLLLKVKGVAWWESKGLAREINSEFASDSAIELGETMQDMLGSNRQLSSRSIGRLLSHRINRIVDGYYLEKINAKPVAKFRVTKAQTVENGKLAIF